MSLRYAYFSTATHASKDTSVRCAHSPADDRGRKRRCYFSSDNVRLYTKPFLAPVMEPGLDRQFAGDPNKSLLPTLSSLRPGQRVYAGVGSSEAVSRAWLAASSVPALFVVDSRMVNKSSACAAIRANPPNLGIVGTTAFRLTN